MEKKTIVPEKSKKRAFIENLIFCILIIIAVVGSVCAWAIVVSKSEEIITNESMHLVEDTQKGVYYDSSNNIYYNDNYTYFDDLPSYVNGNDYFKPSNNLKSFNGFNGSSFITYNGVGNTLFNFETLDNPITLGTTIFDRKWLSFRFGFDSYLWNKIYYELEGSNPSEKSLFFLPFLYVLNNDNFISHFGASEDCLLFELNFYGNWVNPNNDDIYNNDLLAWYRFTTDFNSYLYDPYGDDEFIHIGYSDYFGVDSTFFFDYDGSFYFGCDSQENNNFTLTYIDFNIYIENDLSLFNYLTYGNCNGLTFGLLTTNSGLIYDLNYLNTFTHGGVDLLFNFKYYLPNYFKFLSYDSYDSIYNEGYEDGFTNGTTNGYANGYQQGVTDTLEQVGTDWFTTNNYVSTISFSYVDDYGVLVPLNFQFDYGSDSVGSYINFTNLSYQQGYTNKLTIYFNYAFLPKLIRSTAPFTSCFNGTASVNVSYFGDGIYGVNNENLDKFGSDNYISLAWDNSVPNTFKLYIQGFSTDIASYEEFFNNGFNQGYDKGTANGYQVGYNAGLQNNNFIGNARLYLLLKYHLILLNKFGILKF